MPYIERDANGKITGHFANPQEGYAEEWADPSDAEFLAYLEPPPTQNEQNTASVKANARRQALVAAIKSANDAQLLTYVQNNTDTNAKMRILLGDLVLLVAGVIRD